MMLGCETDNESESNMETISDQVLGLFKEDGQPSKIKDSTNQVKIREVQEALTNIALDPDNNGNTDLFLSLQSKIDDARMQLSERERASDQPENNKQGEEERENEDLKKYQPSENDIVFSNNQLKNRDILEEFMQAAGEKGENNESDIKKIRVVKDEGIDGVLIYDLESRYDEFADQRWIGVLPDLSYYNAPENEPRDVFNIQQQCSYMTENKETEYYVLMECKTHWEYPLLPITNNEG